MIDREETAEEWAPPRGSDPRPLGEALTALSRDRSWEGRLDGARIYGAWREIAGAELVRHTQPVRLHGGVLVVRAVTTMWAAEVRALGGVLAARVDAVLGEGSVRHVTVVTGPLVPDEQAHPPSTGD